MTLEFVNDYINKKLNENEDIIIYTFYELRMKHNLSEEDTNLFLDLNKTRFENIGYKVYKTGDKFIYNNANRTVQDNELFVAIKKH